MAEENLLRPLPTVEDLIQTGSQAQDIRDIDQQFYYDPSGVDPGYVRNIYDYYMGGYNIPTAAATTPTQPMAPAVTAPETGGQGQVTTPAAPAIDPIDYYTGSDEADKERELQETISTTGEVVGPQPVNILGTPAKTMSGELVDDPFGYLGVTEQDLTGSPYTTKTGTPTYGPYTPQPVSPLAGKEELPVIPAEDEIPFRETSAFYDPMGIDNTTGFEGSPELTGQIAQPEIYPDVEPYADPDEVTAGLFPAEPMDPEIVQQTDAQTADELAQTLTPEDRQVIENPETVEAYNQVLQGIKPATDFISEYGQKAYGVYQVIQGGVMSTSLGLSNLLGFNPLTGAIGLVGKDSPSQQEYESYTPTQQQAIDKAYGPGGAMEGYNPVSALGEGVEATINERIANRQANVSDPDNDKILNELKALRNTLVTQPTQEEIWDMDDVDPADQGVTVTTDPIDETGGGGDVVGPTYDISDIGGEDEEDYSPEPAPAYDDFPSEPAPAPAPVPTPVPAPVPTPTWNPAWGGSDDSGSDDSGGGFGGGWADDGYW